MRETTTASWCTTSVLVSDTCFQLSSGEVVHRSLWHNNLSKCCAIFSSCLWCNLVFESVLELLLGDTDMFRDVLGESQRAAASRSKHEADNVFTGHLLMKTSNGVTVSFVLVSCWHGSTWTLLSIKYTPVKLWYYQIPDFSGNVQNMAVETK